tara:strand:- start:268 stop:651 length:384 start_codon:yes stop_codon:yes gene_type:complete
MEPLTAALIASGIKKGADMYGRHRQGQAQRRVDEETAAEQRRVNAIAMLRRQQASRIAQRQAAMPKDARILGTMANLASLGNQLYGLKGGSTPESQVSSLLDRGLIRRGAGGGGGLTYDSPYSRITP